MVCVRRVSWRGLGGEGKCLGPSDLLDVLACSSGSPSTPSNSIIQQLYCLAVASTELCELVVIVIVRTALL